MSETDEITIRNIDAALTKINIQPGDVLLVSVPHIRSMEERRLVEQAFNGAFGVPAVVLHNGMKVDAVLSIARECLEAAEAERQRQADELAGNIRKVLGTRERS